MSKLTLLVAALIAASGCRTPGDPRCPVGETRCEGEVAQICDPGGRWQILLDCRRVAELNQAVFTCEPVVIEDGEVGRLPGHTCVLAGAGGATPDGGAR